MTVTTLLPTITMSIHLDVLENCGHLRYHHGLFHPTIVDQKYLVGLE
jgi:hypothetical protein